MLTALSESRGCRLHNKSTGIVVSIQKSETRPMAMMRPGKCDIIQSYHQGYIVDAVKDPPRSLIISFSVIRAQQQ